MIQNSSNENSSENHSDNNALKKWSNRLSNVGFIVSILLLIAGGYGVYDQFQKSYFKFSVHGTQVIIGFGYLILGVLGIVAFKNLSDFSDLIQPKSFKTDFPINSLSKLNNYFKYFFYFLISIFILIVIVIFVMILHR